MPNHQRYNKSPLIEAVIDIRVELPPDSNVEVLAPIESLISGYYPKREELRVVQGVFKLGSTPTSTEARIGYSYRSSDGKYVLQTRTNGLTLSRLPSYEHWELLRDEARRLWHIYREVARPIRSTRVAVRYINRIDIDGPKPFELKDYFLTYPEISPGINPQVLSGFLMQTLIPQPDFEGMLSLILTSAQAPKPDVASINLDIDLFKESTKDFDTEEKIWNFLEFLRDRKDSIFESCITPRLDVCLSLQARRANASGYSIDGGTRT